MIKPLRSNVLMKSREQAQSTIAGLIISSNVSNEAEIVAVGSETKELHVGDKVRFDSSSTVKIDDLLMCREADILCIIE